MKRTRGRRRRISEGGELFHPVTRPVVESYVGLLREETGPNLFGPRFTEPDRGGYARVQVPAAAWRREGTSHYGGMTVTVLFAAFTSWPFPDDDQFVTHYALFRTAVGRDPADVLFWAPLDTSRSLYPGVAVSLDIVISEPIT